MPTFEAPVDVNGDLTVVGDVTATNLGDAAFMDVGIVAGTVAAGDDPRFGAGGGPPTGAAGGVLSGTYPAPGFAQDMATQIELDAAVTAINAAAVKLHAATHASGGTDPVTLAQSQITGLTAALTAKADDTLVVHKAGAESITGAKTFTAPIQVPHMGIGNPPSSDRLMIVTGPIPGTQAATYGQTFTPTVPATSTTGHTALYLRVDTAAAAFTVNSITGLNVNAPNMGAGSSTNFLSGIAVGAMTAGASSNVGISIAAAGSSTLWLDSGALNTTANAGIGFGQNRDTRLYRSAVGELKTDGVFVVATSVAIGTNPAIMGAIRLPAATQITWRNNANTQDTSYIYHNSSGGLQINGEASVTIYVAGGGTQKIAFQASTMTFIDAYNLAVGSTTGTKIGTATTQKLGFWNTTPVVQPANTVAIDTLLATIGLRAAGGTANFASNISAPNIGGAASLNVGTTAGTVAAGDDPRFGAGGGGGPPTGAAGGVLSGTYPDPGFAVDPYARANHTGSQSYTTVTGLGGAATLNVGTVAGTVAAGDDSRFTTMAVDTAVVHIAGTETITGTKTLSSLVNLPAGMALGTPPVAATGLVRTPTAFSWYSRNAGDNADELFLSRAATYSALSNPSQVILAPAGVNQVIANSTGVAVAGAVTIGLKAATSGTIRLANAAGIVWRDQPDTTNAVSIATTSTNALQYAASGSHQFVIGANSPLIIGGTTLILTDAVNLQFGTVTGTKIGTVGGPSGQLIGFFGVTPIVQPANTVAIDTLLANLGLRVSGGTANFAGSISAPNLGGAAFLNVGTVAGTVAAGNDSRFSTMALDTAVVHIAGTETITGTKTFAAATTIASSGPAGSGALRFANSGFIGWKAAAAGDHTFGLNGQDIMTSTATIRAPVLSSQRTTTTLDNALTLQATGTTTTPVAGQGSTIRWSSTTNDNEQGAVRVAWETASLNSYMAFFTSNATTNSVERMRIASTGLVTMPGSLTVTGAVTGSSTITTVTPDAYRYGGLYGTNYVWDSLASVGSNLWASPVPKYLWHDIFGFCKYLVPTQETSTDGSTWNSATLNRDLFAGKYGTMTTVPANNHVRWTWFNAQYTGATWVAITYNYSVPVPNATVTIETSTDGTTWTSRNTTAQTATHSTTQWYYTGIGDGLDTYFRIRIQNPSANPLIITSIKSLVSSKANQAAGWERELPYQWDGSQRMAFGIGSVPANGNVTVGVASSTTAADGLWFGTDVNLYRSGANILKTDDYVFMASTAGIGASPTTSAALTLPDGTVAAQGIQFGSDVSLYRAAAQVLYTPTKLMAGTGVEGRQSGALAPFAAASAVIVRQMNTTVGNASEIAFQDGAGTISSGIASYNRDHVNHYSDIRFYTRDTDGFVNRMWIGPAATLNFSEGFNIALGTSTGTKIGTSATNTQKLGFFNANPIVRPAVSGFYSSDVDNTIGTIKSVVQNLLTALTNLGLVSVTTPLPP